MVEIRVRISTVCCYPPKRSAPPRVGDQRLRINAPRLLRPFAARPGQKWPPPQLGRQFSGSSSQISHGDLGPRPLAFGAIHARDSGGHDLSYNVGKALCPGTSPRTHRRTYPTCPTGPPLPTRIPKSPIPIAERPEKRK